MLLKLTFEFTVFHKIWSCLNLFAGQFVTGLSPSKTVFYLLPTKSNGGPCNARPEIWRGHGFEPLLTAFCAAKHRLSRKSVSHTTILPLKPWGKAPTKLGRFKGFLCYKVRGIFAFYLQRGCVVFIFILCAYILQWIIYFLTPLLTRTSLGFTGDGWKKRMISNP